MTTRVKETTAATLTLDQRISRDGVELFTAEVMVVLVSRAGKPLRLSTALRGALQDKRRLSILHRCHPGSRAATYPGPRETSYRPWVPALSAASGVRQG